MSLHTDWVAAKKAAKKTFETSLTKAENTSYATGGIDYALDEVFSKNLGPDLDKYEKEKNSQKKAGLVQKIHSTIETYKTQIKKHEKKLGTKGSAIVSALTKELNDIKAAVQ